MPHPDKVFFEDPRFGDISAKLPVNGHEVPAADVTPRPWTFLSSDLPK